VFTIESEDGGIDTVRNVETFWFGEVEIDASTYRLAFDDANAADELVEAGADGPGDDAAGGNVLDNDKPQGSPSVVRVGAGGIADTDVDGDGVVVNGTYGVLTITSDGTWNYELDNARAATNSLADGVTAHDVFTYRFSNGNGFDTAKLTIAIVGSNDAPVAGDDTLTGSHLEDAAIVVPSAVLLANDGDVDGQTLTVASVAGAQHGAVSLVSGNVLFTPDANYSGAASFTYKVSDGTLEGNWATVSFTITAQNDEPVTDDMRIAVSQGHSYVFTATDVPFSDPDAGDTRQGIVLVSLPTHGVLKLGSATVSAGQLLTDAQIGQLTYVAPTNVSGEGADTFEFKVFDGAATSAAKAITFDIAAGNSAPVANNDGLFVGPYLEDMAISIAAITLTANDVDPDTGQTLSIVSVSDAQHGSVALVSGNVVFTPDANYAGPASFTYVVSDGALTSNAASVTLSLIPVPDAPAASDRQVTIAEDGSYTVSSADFAFSDPDAGDVLQSVKIVSLPGSGTLTLGGVPVAPGQSIAVASVSQLSFTPSANAHGSPLSSFAFTVSDGTLDSAAKTFSINVTAGSDTPVAVDDAGFATAEDTPITFIASVLLGNDGDADGDSLAIASVASGAGGTAVLNLDGTVTFTPLPNFSGAASFSYRAKDGSGALSGVAVASLTVTPVNDAPAFTRGVGVGPSAALAFLEGTSEVYAIAASDIDSATLTYSLEGEDAGDFVISGSTLLFKAASDFEAPADSDGNNIYRVAVVVSDGVLTDRQELVISVLDATGNTVVGTKKADTVDLMHKVGLLGATDEADLIKGQAGKDTIGAAAGDDTVQGGSGKDELDGGAGFDLADYSDKTASVTATLSGSSDARVRVGGTNEDTIRNFEGVVGGRAADKLTGDAGANLLSGGGGNDMLSGKAGDDTLTGGKGNDRFVFDGKIKFGSVDVITDFKHNKDVIVLDDKIAKAIGSSLSAGEFYAKAHAVAAHDADDRIIYNRTTGDIFYDADGDKAGGKDAILFATLSTHPALDAGDFLIV
jgi:VCBS repeat-containing protein